MLTLFSNQIYGLYENRASPSVAFGEQDAQETDMNIENEISYRFPPLHD
jgi:hypothetical protein